MLVIAAMSVKIFTVYFIDDTCLLEFNCLTHFLFTFIYVVVIYLYFFIRYANDLDGSTQGQSVWKIRFIDIKKSPIIVVDESYGYKLYLRRQCIEHSTSTPE